MEYKINGKNNFVLIDKEDLEKISQYTWCLIGNKDKPQYAYSSKLKTVMHRFILGHKVGLDIDHINHNGLDNRKENLRHCTRSENIRNSKKYTRSKGGIKSIYTGVYWDKKKKIWRSQISIAGTTKALGTFKSEILAAEEYNKALIELNPEYGKLNFTR